jgi:hypothetical protein
MIMNTLVKKLSLVSSAIVIISMLTLVAVAANTGVVVAANTGPYLYIDPSEIPADDTANIYIRPTSDATEIAEMQNLGPPSTYSYCPDFLYANVHQVTVATPDGDKYMLGDATKAINKNNAPPDGLAIRVDPGDLITIPFGPGAGAINIEGTLYYWWRISEGGSPVSPSERLDLVPDPSPTGVEGTYMVDVEGWNVCGEDEQNIRTELWFDIFAEFEVTEEDEYCGMDTAYAKVISNDGEFPQCFIPDFNNWGWTNYLPGYGEYEFDVWAGAGQCDTAKGTLVGTLTITYDGAGLSWDLELAEGYVLNTEDGEDEVHVYAGTDPYPERDGSPTVAPGLYRINLPSGDQPIWVIFQAVVAVPCE